MFHWLAYVQLVNTCISISNGTRYLSSCVLRPASCSLQFIRCTLLLCWDKGVSFRFRCVGCSLVLGRGLRFVTSDLSFILHAATCNPYGNELTR
jgi:hypothetical protein